MPMMMSQTIWTKSKAWADKEAVPPLFPTWQKPFLATVAPAQRASSQPHQYVTPSIPQTGSVVKHLTGQETGLCFESQTSIAVCDSTTVGKDQKLRLNIDITKKKRDNDDLENAKNIIILVFFFFFALVSFWVSVEGELKKIKLAFLE